MEKKMNGYETRTTKDLIETYAWINKRATADPHDKQFAKSLIRQELKRRFCAVFEFLDDGQNDENPEATMRYLLGE